MSNYSGYHSEGAPSSNRSSRKSRRPVYEETIIESRKGRNQPPVQQALVRRPRSDSSSSIEEIDREFDPENGTYVQRRSVIRDRYGDNYGPPRPRSDGGYTGRGRRGGRRRRDSYDSYDSFAESESSRSRSRPRRRSKSRGEKALEAVGLGGAAGAIANRVRSMSRGARSRRGSRDSSEDSSYYYHSRSRSRGARARSGSRGRGSSRSPTKKQKFEDAAKAAVAAAAIEAWRARKEVPGDAGKRILTAALASAGIDAAVQRDKGHGNRNAIVSAIGGLATNRLINGQTRSRSRPRDRRGDHNGGELGTAASVAALAAIAGKAIKDQHDRKRSKSRSRMRDNDDSDDGGRYSPSNRRRKSLSEHLYKPTDAVLGKMGLGDSSYHHPKYAKDRYGRRHYSDDENDYYDDGPRLRGGGGDDSDSDDCSTDSYSSDEEEKKIKKTRTKSLITGGLAAVASVHAAHSVYNSMEARESRHRKVMQGKMSPEEARRLKTKAALQDVAAVGIAALGIKGAVSEWKEVREHRNGIKNRRLRLDEMREHRQKKIDQGLWDEETWRQKREDHFGSGAGSRSSNRARSASRPSSRSEGRRRIAYGDYDDGSSRGSRRRGQSARRYSDDYDDYYDDDYYHDEQPRSRRSHRSSMPSEGGRRLRREYVEKYVSSKPLEISSSRDTDDGPRYADGNPYGGTWQSSPLSSQLPPPPLKYDSMRTR